MQSLREIPSFLVRDPRVVVLDHEYGSSALESELFEKVLEHFVVAVCVDPEVSALIKGPVQAELADAFGLAVSREPVDHSEWFVVAP